VRLRPALAALAALIALAAPAPAAALDAATVRAGLTRAIAGAGPASGAYARDLETGTELVAVRADAPRIPASVQKLFVTAAALLRHGPSARLETRAVTNAAVDDRGVLRGHLWLVGGGDPVLAEADLRRMAATVAGAGIRRIAGDIVADDSRFDRRRGGPRTGFAIDRDLGGRLGALVLARGFQASPTTHVARRFAAHLQAAGVRVDGAVRVGRAPAGAEAVAVDTSPPIADLVRRTNVPSDNFIAEMLLKELGAAFGAGGTTAAGAAVVRDTLADLGVRPRIDDGSGLSRRNRTTPRQVVRLLEQMERQPVAVTWRSSLALAGRTGTVRLRMRGSAAHGRCRVKTGTLRAVSTLAGVCTTVAGRPVAFAWLMNGVNPSTARAIQDRMTALLSRYSG
jgi:D-alanyl-D-alanine carboxypeptidase/D-alanyl-D-alanine-endopeptidase (penicillin-binding protein 4)